MLEYYNKLLDTSNNSMHLEYYKEMILKFEGKKQQSNYTPRYMFKININRVYSSVLNKHFRSMSEASKYVRKGRSYTRRCIIGELENKYEFKIV